MKVLSLALDVLDGDFDKLVPLISMLLSYAVVAGSFSFKVPQILKIVKAKSAEGISISMLWMETCGYMIAALYNYSHGYQLATYAENCFIILQNYALINLVALYQKAFSVQFFIIASALIAWCAVSLLGMVPMAVHGFLMTTVQIPLHIMSRVPQIRSIYKNKSTGQLALITFVLAFAGSAARVFTNLTTSADTLLLTGYGFSLLLNSIIMLQFALYWNSDKEKKSA